MNPEIKSDLEAFISAAKNLNVAMKPVRIKLDEMNLVTQLEQENQQLRQLSQELLEAAKEVARISDRKHDAWDRLKTAIQKAEEQLKQK